MASLLCKSILKSIFPSIDVVNARRSRTNKFIPLCFVLCLRLVAIGNAAPLQAGGGDDGKSESNPFDAVAPLLFERCLGCHGGATIEGGYSVADIDSIFRPGDSGAMPVSQSQIESSEFLVRFTAKDSTIRMPLDAEPLSNEEIVGVRKWIESGAKTGEANGKTSLAEIYGKRKTSPRPPQHYAKPLPISSILLTADSKQIVVGGYSEILVWNIESQSLETRIPVRGRMVSDMEWAPGGLLVVASGIPGKFGVLEAFDFKMRERISAFGFSRDVCTSIASSPYRNEMVAGFADGSVAVYSLDTFKVRAELVPHAAAITSLHWTSKGNRILTSSLDRSAKSFDATDLRLLFAYAENERAVSNIVDSQYGPITMDETGVMRAWTEGEEARSLAKKDGLPQKVQPIASTREMVFVPENNKVRRLYVQQDEVLDDKAKDAKKDDGKESKPKMKTRTRWKEHEPLQSSPNQSILSLTANSVGAVAAGLDNGRVLIWTADQSASPSYAWLALP